MEDHAFNGPSAREAFSRMLERLQMLERVYTLYPSDQFLIQLMGSLQAGSFDLTHSVAERFRISSPASLVRRRYLDGIFGKSRPQVITDTKVIQQSLLKASDGRPVFGLYPWEED